MHRVLFRDRDDSPGLTHAFFFLSSDSSDSAPAKALPVSVPAKGMPATQLWVMKSTEGFIRAFGG